MTLSLDTAYRSFGGEVEASSTPTICRLPDSRRHQLSAIARDLATWRGNMKALSLGLFLAITTFSNAHAQRSPDSLPAVTVDCYQSFAAKTQLPELPSKDIVVDGGNFETPLVRYRLQVV